MRYLLSFFLFLVFLNCQKKDNKPEFIKAKIISSKIDSLNSKEKVEEYIRGLSFPIIENFELQKLDLTHNFLEKFELKKIADFNREFDSITKIIADSLNISKSFYLMDIDNNGFTDLIIIGDDKGCNGGHDGFDQSCDFSAYCFMNFGNNNIKPIDLILENSVHKSIVPKFSKNKGLPLLEIHEPAEFNWKKEKTSSYKMFELTYEFGSLIEYNDNPQIYDIEKVEFKTETSGYKHPHFEILIKNDQTALLDAKYGNSIYENTKVYFRDTIPELKGKFRTNIKNNDYDNLVNILNYIDFPNMEHQYSINRLHTRNCSLKITYNNGKVKEIKDYGMVGTYGLRKIYELLFDFRFNQNWKENTTANTVYN
ncbi:hypothetical protein [Winogradskyella psychrotolerans]|uniref:DUF6438 domain-containing protein n=1 Tax=Winogradskyella psychrotolerans TaxID=1344585 RepID=UPI001C07A46A|nr:hypothetical protein [Winogradskyella psychrotolerans]MBU2929623.1 hypothetical protein [Winogradskyella psychrotolerans]